MSYAIKVSNLGKQYTIGASQGRYKSLRDSLTQAVSAPFRRLLAREKDDRADRTIWALKDVSFEIAPGEVVGIIGRNGAGKSTLLKLLARITEPTTGEIRMRGRVGSLLEVGTGFHPELTGRENIFLNGAILGMSRREIERKFDEIVDFAELEKFIDTPAKHLSSGMYMRLAFAVAAHLEPEILLVDEVLAVGDAQFQKKCLGKMGEVAKEGRTVLFVSHNMAAIQQLCKVGITLHSGRVEYLGKIEGAIECYVQGIKFIQKENLAERTDRQGSQWLKFVRVGFFNENGDEIREVVSGQDISIRFYYTSSKSLKKAKVNIAFNVRSNYGYLLTNLNSLDVNSSSLDVLYQSGYFQCNWYRFNMRSGIYDCTLFCEVNGEIVDWLQSAFVIHVEDGDFYNTGRIIDRSQGDILVSYNWTSQVIGDQ